MHPPSDNACLEQSCAIEHLAPYANNARTHSKKQVRQIADSIRRFGFCNPVLIADDNTIIAGHSRVEAAKLIGMMGDAVVQPNTSYVGSHHRRQCTAGAGCM